MQKLAAITAVAVSLAFGSALAQTTAPAPAPMAKSNADCEANFKTADANNDGQLVKTEIDAHKTMVPTTLASNATVSKAEFMSACTTGAAGQKK